MTFRQTAFTDGDDPVPTALSSPMLINITDDDIFEGVEYFQARIVETSDRFRVRIGQDTVNVTINDSESFINLGIFAFLSLSVGNLFTSSIILCAHIQYVVAITHCNLGWSVILYDQLD